ncbi:hypothetical protein [Enterovibrio nigricans]|uniref:hypothetical protein n=1 Tax=Enterovibrio nigricans TaxID=504469 RepID=UPI001117777A|nr:hypothetical protein [Enterovibrio nigricans]
MPINTDIGFSHHFAERLVFTALSAYESASLNAAISQVCMRDCLREFSISLAVFSRLSHTFTNDKSRLLILCMVGVTKDKNQCSVALHTFTIDIATSRNLTHSIQYTR